MTSFITWTILYLNFSFYAPLKLGLDIAYALTIPFQRRQFEVPISTSGLTLKLDNFDFENDNDASSLADVYTAVIMLNEQRFPVQVDTGSSDLWLDTSGIDLDCGGIIDTGLQQEISYGDGTIASGRILKGNVTFGGITIPQAFISAPGSNATTNRDRGLLGVGPPSLSIIKKSLQNQAQFGNEAGSTLIENIFRNHPSLLPITTFQLSRSETTGVSSGGVFTIGEVESGSEEYDTRNDDDELPGLAAVQNSPKLPVLSSDRFVVPMDGVMVNGRMINGNSAFANAALLANQTLANLDTGTTLATMPTVYADAIFSDIEHTIDEEGNIVVACDTKLNMSFMFGGVEIPIHPIDTVQALSDGQGGIRCISGFYIVDPDPNVPDGQDFLLGDTFFRNVYALFDYGAFVGQNYTPFVQLLSTTNMDTAFAEFETLSALRNASILSSASSSR